MQKGQIFIFFDDVIREYFECYGKKGEKILLEHLRKYLSRFSETSEIIILTNQEESKIVEWFKRNKLLELVSKISNQSYS